VCVLHARLGSPHSVDLLVQDATDIAARHARHGFTLHPCRKCDGKLRQKTDDREVWVAAQGEQSHFKGERWSREVRVLFRCPSCLALIDWRCELTQLRLTPARGGCGATQ
jgi:hypothetical protein